MENKEARIDKWLWAARICKKGQVSIQGAVLKPSRMVKVGYVINVRKPPITYSFRILKAIERRIGAKLIPEVLENVTSPDQFELLEMSKISGFVNRAKGTGRPTKKERRNLEEFTNETPLFFGDFDFDDDDDNTTGED